MTAPNRSRNPLLLFGLILVGVLLVGGAIWLALARSGPANTTQTAATAVPTNLPAPTPRPKAERGATVPWIEYEAEAATSNGTTLATTRTFGEIAAEASGRQAVQLDSTGQFVEFKASEPANALVLRYVIPDAPNGGGITATLSLYVDGTFRQKLQLTSRFAWSYGGETETFNAPSAQGPHHFFDEARALVGDVPAGATVKLQKDGDDSAAFYVVDLVDLEQVAPPTAMPDGFLSISDCGATPDDATDDGPAIQACIDRAQTQNKGVWIPAGRFESTSKPRSEQGISFSEVAIRGAGMWHSTIHGPFARFHCIGSHCQLADFSILGETTQRNDDVPENGVNGAAGKGSRMENVWIEHTKVGWWVGEGRANVTDGLVITGSRFRNLFADGVNLCNGASNSVVENSHFRNTGDDALASWAPSFDGGVNTNNTFRFNTVQVPWRANCFAIYGGKDNRVEDNLCYDVVTYPGILIALDFRAHPFSGTTTVQRNSLVRAGGMMWLRPHGALKIQAALGSISNVVVKDIDIESPTFSGIEIQGPNPVRDSSFEHVRIANAGASGITISTSGDGSFSDVTVESPTGEALVNKPMGGKFEIIRGEGNSGW